MEPNIVNKVLKQFGIAREFTVRVIRIPGYIATLDKLYKCSLR
jgi:hypothetical protein